MINIINPMLMEKKVIFNLSLAVVYGFGLIILSLVMALVYNVLCVKKESAMNGSDAQGKVK